MILENSAMYQNAVQLAQSRQTRAAYERFCALASDAVHRSNPNLLLWIAETTPSLDEAQRAINEVSQIAPYHPGLPQAQALLARRSQPMVHMHYVETREVSGYRCPHCGTAVQPVIENKISGVGWTVFFILLCTIILSEICWLGLFIRKNYVVCPMCNGNLDGLI